LGSGVSVCACFLAKQIGMTSGMENVTPIFTLLDSFVDNMINHASKLPEETASPA
jgi:hypothetical protein